MMGKQTLIGLLDNEILTGSAGVFIGLRWSFVQLAARDKLESSSDLSGAISSGKTFQKLPREVFPWFSHPDVSSTNELHRFKTALSLNEIFSVSFRPVELSLTPRIAPGPSESCKAKLMQQA